MDHWDLRSLENTIERESGRIREELSRANTSPSSDSPIFSPKTRRKIIIGVLLFFFCFGILGDIVCFIAYFILDALGKI